MSRRQATGGTVRRWSALAAAAALVVAGCGGGDESATEGTEAGGAGTGASTAESDVGGAGSEASAPGGSGEERELIIARDMDLTTMDPSRMYCDTCQIFLSAVYETLVGVDPDDINTLVPRLAESWEGNADSTVFTFKLNPDATFADGSQVTSEDVKFSFERLGGIKGNASYLASDIASIDTPDPLTVVVNFDAPNAAFPAITSATFMSVLNKAELVKQGATTDEQDPAEDWFFTNSAGTGQFVLESFTAGDSLVIVRNDNYWGERSPLPKVTIKQVKDATAQLQQLQAGDVDIAQQISFDALGQLEGVEGVTTEVVPSYGYVHLAFSPGRPGGEALTPGVRLAIKKAIDYDGLLQATIAGNGRLQASPIPNGFPGSEDLELPEQDIEGAQALLEEEGVSDLTLTAAYPSINVYGVDFDTMMAKIQQDLTKIGINLDLEPLEYATWVDRIQSDDGIPVSAIFFAPDYIDSGPYVAYFGRLEGSVWQERSGEEVSQEQTDLYAKALATSDRAEKEDLYRQLGELLIEDLINVPIVNPDVVLAYASDLSGVRVSACCTFELRYIAVN